MRYRVEDGCLVIMAKAPVPGRVKTRLIPAIGAASAATLHRQMLWEVTTKMLRSNICPIQLWCDPTIDHPDFYALEKAGAHLFTQSGKDLGDRMAHALTTALKEFRAAAVIGCDCPGLSPDVIYRTFGKLDDKTIDVVLGPAEDGGYYLLGASKPCRGLFRDITWGTSNVLAQSRAKLLSLGCRWHELETLWDLDEVEDLRRLGIERRLIYQTG